MTNRRQFLSLATTACAAGGLCGCKSIFSGAKSEDLSVFISDVHVGKPDDEDYTYTLKKLESTVDEILAMSPLPKRVVCFGDLALSFGLYDDYAMSKPALERLTKAGIELYITMGNHDRRKSFRKYWPEYFAKSPVPNRTVSVIDLGTADLVLLDTLKGGDGEPKSGDYGPVEGTIDPEQLKWFDEWVKNAKRPFFVGSHQFVDLYLPEKPTPIKHAAASKFFQGWIYGHDHQWSPQIQVLAWGQPGRECPSLALPSTGLWGDIGYVIFRTYEDGAEASLVQSDFYFTRPDSQNPRPKMWDYRVADNQGHRLRYTYK